MADTLETLMIRRDRLQKAIDTGAEAVARGDNRTEFRDLNKMQASLADLDRRIAGLEGSPQSIRRIYATGGKGL